MQGLDHVGDPAIYAPSRAKTAMERSALYGFLATVYRSEPSAESLGKLRDPAFQDAFGLEIKAGSEAAMAEELAVEYAALFLGPGGHISPHESVHVKGGGQLLGSASSAVKAYIEACGFEYAAETHVLPDHISVELDFMAEVTRQESQAWTDQSWDKVQNCLAFEEEFSADHLRLWVPDFCQAVLASAEHPFYRQVVEITRDFLLAEKDEIEDRLKSLSPADEAAPDVDGDPAQPPQI